MSYVVCVTFKISSGFEANFLELIKENARQSVEGEDACSRFDVLTSTDDPAKIFLYEVYNSKAGFETHLKTDHFLKFDAATKNMIDTKKVEIYRLENA